jgi:hypothetical protein
MVRYRDLFKEPYPKLKRLASRYTGFKFYLLLLLCSFTVSLLVAARRAHAVPQLGTIFSFDWIEYISTFWISHPWVFGIFVLTYVATLLLNVLEAPFKERVLSIPPTAEEDDHFKRLFRRANRYMTIFIVPDALVQNYAPSVQDFQLLHTSRRGRSRARCGRTDTAGTH